MDFDQLLGDCTPGGWLKYFFFLFSPFFLIKIAKNWAKKQGWKVFFCDWCSMFMFLIPSITFTCSNAHQMPHVVYNILRFKLLRQFFAKFFVILIWKEEEWMENTKKGISTSFQLCKHLKAGQNTQQTSYKFGQQILIHAKWPSTFPSGK